MKTKKRRFAILLLTAMLLLGLVGCGDDSLKSDYDTNSTASAVSGHGESTTEAKKEETPSVTTVTGGVVNGDLDFAEIDIQLAIVKGLTASDYTADSWERVEQALALASTVHYAETQTEVDLVVALLRSALDSLVRQSTVASTTTTTRKTSAATTRATTTRKSTTTTTKPKIETTTTVAQKTWQVVTGPSVGVAYKFGLDQAAKGAIYFFTGRMSGYYGATDTDVSLAVDMYLEYASGGYKIYFKGTTGRKQYIKLEQSGTHYNFCFGDEGSVFTYDADRCSFYTTAGDAVCYMGTYGNYVTIGCLTAEKMKDSDYIAHFYVYE